MSSKNEAEKPIVLSPHAKEKLKRLALIGVTADKAVKTIKHPKALFQGISAEKSLNLLSQTSFCLELSMNG
jgi:hypothetical protein